MAETVATSEVFVGPERLGGFLGLPAEPKGLVIFAHGAGSSRFSPRNVQVAKGLQQAGLGTLLLDLLNPQEASDRANVFDMGLLAERLGRAVRWAKAQPELESLPAGFFGASTGAGAALVAAAYLGGEIAAVVSRGGRPDLAGSALPRVMAATLLIVGGADTPVIPLNKSAFDRLRCPKEMIVIPDATHLFEEPGKLEAVLDHARAWFLRFLTQPRLEPERSEFADRAEAGRVLASELAHLKDKQPIVLALPRGGVPVGYEIARALDAPLDVVFVRKIGAPGQPELGLGAVVDGAHPQLVLNDERIELVGATPQYLEAEKNRQLAEIEQRRALYEGVRPPLPVAGRTIIVVDDGIATGGTVTAVLQALRQNQPERLVLAVPVGPRETLTELANLADEVIVPMTPDPFYSVGAHYRDFTQTSDAEVIDLLARANADR